MTSECFGTNKTCVRLGLFLLLLIFTVSVNAEESMQEQFKLEGKHTFEDPGAATWTVAQELIDEESGESSRKEDFATAKGTKVNFSLPKVSKKETIYHITATGDATRKFKVWVFASNKISSFLYQTELNPPVRIFIFLPKSLSPNTRFIVVMHGMSRTALKYIESWEKWAGKNDYAVIAPLFDAKDWNGTRKYNAGNVFTKDDKKVRQKKWTFQIVDDLQKHTASALGLKSDIYDIFGHSAGGQFCPSICAVYAQSKNTSCSCRKSRLVHTSGFRTGVSIRFETRRPFVYP